MVYSVYNSGYLYSTAQQKKAVFNYNIKWLCIFNIYIYRDRYVYNQKVQKRHPDLREI